MKIDTYLDIAYGIGLIFTIVVAFLYLFLRDKAPKDPKFKAKIQKIIDDAFKDIDSEKKKYHGGRVMVEEWKKKMQATADRIILLYQEEGQTERVWKAAKTLDQDLLTGLDLIQNGENPLTDFNHEANKKVRSI